MKNVLFDLDGTVIDPKLGIIKSIHFALEQMGIVPDSLGSLDWCIGPPLLKSFEKIFDHQLKAQEAVDFFRRRYAVQGLTECHVYEGIIPILQALKDHSKKVYIATSKPHSYALQIIRNLGLDIYFTAIYGSELDGTNSEKSHLISHVLRSENLDPTECIMIGDREHDIFGSQLNRVKAVGVSWGYGSRQELTQAGAERIFSDPTELCNYLLEREIGFQGA